LSFYSDRHADTKPRHADTKPRHAGLDPVSMRRQILVVFWVPGRARDDALKVARDDALKVAREDALKVAWDDALKVAREDAGQESPGRRT